MGIASTLLGDIEQCVVLGVGDDPQLRSLREEWRGGSANGQGENITEGIAPVPDSGGTRYSVDQSSAPCVFVSDTVISFSDDCSMQYGIELTLVLPTIVDGEPLSERQINTAAVYFAEALWNDRQVSGSAIIDRLIAAGLSSVVGSYQVQRLGVGGSSEQHRLVAELQFDIPQRALI